MNDQGHNEKNARNTKHKNMFEIKTYYHNSIEVKNNKDSRVFQQYLRFRTALQHMYGSALYDRVNDKGRREFCSILRPSREEEGRRGSCSKDVIFNINEIMM